MKLIIDIPNTAYEAIQAVTNIDGSNEGTLENVLIKAVEDGKPIPDNVTNGDMIKAMFHYLEKYEYEEPYTHGIALAGNDNRVTWFANEWWNAPYQKGCAE